MDSLVQPRPNHYQLLGLTPAATGDEIRRAFAREISPLRPRSCRSITELGVALETLRDPLKRQAYDASLGLMPAPAPTRALQGWQYAGPVRFSRPCGPAIDPAAAARRESEKPPESRSGSPSQSLWEAARTLSSIESLGEVERPRPRDAESRRLVAPLPDWVPAPSVPIQRRTLALDGDAVEWKRPAVVLGGIMLAVGLMGVLAGLWASRDVQSKAAESTVEITASDQHQADSSTAPVAGPAAPQAREMRRAHIVSKPPAVRRVASTPKPPAPTEQKAEDLTEISSEQVAALTSGIDDTPAKLPLPESVVARTLGRLGYSCGEVASSTAVEGAPGAFKVTCTSGKSFKAAPVHGRYHFRRWAAQE